MPQSDAWPGGAGVEAAGGLDGAGSWDSVVSVTSGCSDDSMDFLSAEERACLMFLEETIDSLDNEEDSGLSNDEPDQPFPGHLHTKMDHSRLSGAQQQDSKKPFLNIPEDHKPIHSSLVPTPLLVARSTTHAEPPERERSSQARSQIIALNSHPAPQPWRSPPDAPSEVNVVVTPPPIKPKSFLSRNGETPPPRGPLSYDALVYLRRSASAKKSPLCPTVDHTLGGAQQPRASTANQNHQDLARAPPSASAHEALDGPCTGLPVVPPKPSKAGPSASPPASNGTPSPTAPPADSSAGKRFPDPQKVRKEALQKLGLLNAEQEPKTGPKASLSHTQSQPAPDPVSQRVVWAPVSRTPPVPKCLQGRPVQSSASFHHCPPRRGQNFLSDSSETNVQPPQQWSTGTVENHGPSLSRSVSMGVQSSKGDGHGHFHHEAVHMKVSEPIRRTAPTGAHPAPSRRSPTVGFSLAVLPSMGADRKEALRKLGLLKD